ncbi:hypothetical protein ACFXPI_20720 [Streptomyces sp. NPDC059104]|uniref:hypothetical protein n=1 Tax=Streptomyces sp. NPDC059104 TaxID=3346729 RepID=UPI00369A6A3C
MTTPSLPPVPEPFRLPFHYGALHQLGVDWPVDPGPVRDLLAKHHPDLSAAEFEGRALVSLNLLDITAVLDGLDPVPANMAPVTGYGTDPDGRLLAGPMNVYQPYRWYDLTAPGHADRIRLTVHPGEEDPGRDVGALIGDAPAAGAWTHRSAPVAAHNRPYYLPSRPAVVGHEPA